MKTVRLIGNTSLLMLVLFVIYVGSGSAQTPVSDEGTHSRLDTVQGSIDTTNTRLGNLETGLVTVQQYQATQVALLDQVQRDLVAIRGADQSGTVTDWRLNESRESDLAGARLGLVVIAGVVCLVALGVAGLVRSWF